MVALMLTAALASLLLGAQPPAAPDQAELAACFDRFVAAEQRAGAPVLELTNAQATACHDEERRFRAAAAARAADQGTSYLAAEGAAYEQAQALRIRARDAFLAAQTTCARGRP